MTLVSDCPDIQNVSIVADPQPGNPLGYQAVVSTRCRPRRQGPGRAKARRWPWPMRLSVSSRPLRLSARRLSSSGSNPRYLRERKSDPPD